ncbi:MAG TPA: hypothetical protein VMR75_00510 [Candidatus Saccharimonadales bacterium]|nr:hypothetical protein [Candidatus Saccharimonadales bacterium]
MTQHRVTFQPSPELQTLLAELESGLGSFGLFLPLFGYQKAVDRGEIAPGDPLPINCGNSGTTMRLLPGWLAGQGRFYEVAGAMGRDKIRRMIELLEAELPEGHFELSLEA